MRRFLNFKYRRKQYSHQYPRPDSVLYITEQISEEAKKELPICDSERKVPKMDYLKHLEIFTGGLDTTRAGCNTVLITEVLTAAETWVRGGNRWENLGSIFKLCVPIERSNAPTSEVSLEVQLRPK